MDKTKKCPYCDTELTKKTITDDYHLWICPSCGYKEVFAPVSFDSMAQMLAKKP